jgi:hypothetical protein
MKMKTKDFQTIKKSFERLDQIVSLDGLKRVYQEREISGMCYRWDMLKVAIGLGLIQKDILKKLYVYLDDSHIDTALKQITGTRYWMTESEIHKMARTLI